MSRVTPLSPPYEPEIDTALRRWMPPGAAMDPLLLFRVLHVHPDLASRMRVLGAGLLGSSSFPPADREVVIARVCARTGCEYEWGVHAAAFGEAVGLTPEQVSATVLDSEPSAVWSPAHRALIAAVDELHDTAHLSDGAWAALREHYDDRQLIEFLVLAGWYRTISYLANGLRLDREAWAARFPGGGA